MATGRQTESFAKSYVSCLVIEPAFGYRIDAGASKTMLDSVMYKFSYYRFAEAGGYGDGGYDRVRNTPIGRKHFKLKYFEEAYTTTHWMVCMEFSSYCCIV